MQYCIALQYNYSSMQLEGTVYSSGPGGPDTASVQASAYSCTAAVEGAEGAAIEYRSTFCVFSPSSGTNLRLYVQVLHLSSFLGFVVESSSVKRKSAQYLA